MNNRDLRWGRVSACLLALLSLLELSLTVNPLAWLDRALQQRTSMLGFLAQNPTFDGLHDDPRFAAIVDRVGLSKRPLTK